MKKPVSYSMASEEQLALSGLIKSVHQRLREDARSQNPAEVWHQHLQNRSLLKEYASAMHQLATNYWDKTMQVDSKRDNSRIEWTVNSCRDYFRGNQLVNFFREKDEKVMKAVDESHSFKYEPYQVQKIKLLDVGSCYNPFAAFEDFEVTAIDIAPAQDSVKYCDFLEVPIISSNSASSDFDQNSSIESIPSSYYDAVVFSLLLEYLPSPDQRLRCCQKAYDVLKPEGILLIITPDSRHQGANAKLMKNWRYTLGLLGFSRIKIEKLEHVTCMVFRKCVFKEVAQRWCTIYKESYMEPILQIPQDYNNAGGSGRMDDAEQNDELVVRSESDMVEIKNMFGGLPFVSNEES
ncbi:S-adenosylmethionine sensor upstream of mTORC1 [Uranotaenia lowii]|uniref:S-adenosylmethionine sensor upstream of mTORC1 n=1 Tax=Uranotaenia lowii TaxID=190385 RepID=UPI00247836FF|nr:S-adenosylmethionine sensor upstream of mTORC1 [Uranotaenia lowii]